MFDTTLPYGFKGLAAAGLIAVSMSAFATNLNLLAISFTRDIMTPFLKASMSDKDELLTMRIMTVAFSVIVCLVACGINIADPTVYFDNVFTMIVFPSMVMLLMGFSYSRKAFLSGVFASAAILLLIIVFGNGDAQTYLVLPIIMLNIGIMYAVNKCKFAKKTKK
ncbi:hypothetical protein FACS1894122_06580 [Alphaproteobacteria bacterium]|nr:hypothetical protein FACS1894122_06580 [Alphaproteobacteria bacterium]